jgi:multisite-specific tRNA:(cytosine-C5)-methyltransferase
MTPSASPADEDVVMESREEGPTTSTSQRATGKGKAKVKGDSGFKENPYTYLAPDDPILQSCMYVYPLSTRCMYV